MKRYQSLYFPALHGNPYETNWYALAWIRVFFAVLAGAWEGRIVDRWTGKHHVL